LHLLTSYKFGPARREGSAYALVKDRSIPQKGRGYVKKIKMSIRERERERERERAKNVPNGPAIALFGKIFYFFEFS
jgi:hypothetical protein